MDVPIAVALAAGYVRGAINTVTGTGPIYFDGVAALIFLLLVGRFLQQRAQRAATNATELLHGLSPATARLVDGGTIREVPTEALLPGMLVEIRAGDTVPADGVVVEGRSELDLALLTGESRPKAASCGDRVFAGTVNLASALRVEVEQSGEESRLGRLLRQVEAGAGRRAPVVQAADRLAGRFVAVILLLALVTFAYWWPRDPDQAIDHAIALLIVTCPCALALATPLAITVAIGRAARAGILIKGGDALELLGRPGTLYLDKTGTLTEGRTRLVAWEGPEAIRPFVLALERHSTHPVADGGQADARRWAGRMGRRPARRGGFTGVRPGEYVGARRAPPRGGSRTDSRPGRRGWKRRRAGRVRRSRAGRSRRSPPAAARARLAPSVALGR
jgi:Cu2+-exporting ATPase